MIVQDDERAKRFIELVLGNKIFEPFAGFVVVEEDDRILGAVILNNFERGLTVDLTVAGPGAFGLKEVRTMARYIFVQLGCQRITAVIKMNNNRAWRTLLSLGFKQEGVLHRRFKDCDGLIFGITREEQRAIRL
jgi:RimJ/RimL family protein N-acetyltransferase